MCEVLLYQTFIYLVKMCFFVLRVVTVLDPINMSKVYQVLAGSRRRWPLAIAWASSHSGNLPRCSRSVCRPCASESWPMPWKSSKGKNYITSNANSNFFGRVYTVLPFPFRTLAIRKRGTFFSNHRNYIWKFYVFLWGIIHTFNLFT